MNERNDDDMPGRFLAGLLIVVVSGIAAVILTSKSVPEMGGQR